MILVAAGGRYQSHPLLLLLLLLLLQQDDSSVEGLQEDLRNASPQALLHIVQTPHSLKTTQQQHTGLEKKRSSNKGKEVTGRGRTRYKGNSRKAGRDSPRDRKTKSR